MPWTIGLWLLNSTQPSKSGRAVDPDGVVQARTVLVVSSQPVRIALTGQTVSEPVNVLLWAVGREESLVRLAAPHPQP